jgi:glycosyltransferase involved in cell wall biosynthesis
MRIAQVSTLSAPVHRDSAGSVESLVWLLTRELQKLGHEVTIFASGDSQPGAPLQSILPAPYAAPGSLDDWHVCEWLNLCHAIRQSERFDLIHTHAYLWGVPLDGFAQCPVVHTTHIVPDEVTARLWTLHPGAHVAAVSKSQWSGHPNLHPAAVIPHGLDVSEFQFCDSPGDYFLYLGRFVSGKGPLHAIKAARDAGRRLIMAGPENVYFREHVKPLVDGKHVQFAGYVSGRQKIDLLRGAATLLYPIQYPEAFGLVLVEAMLCGTPVVAMNLGAVPEIVEPGVSGYHAATPEEFRQAIPRALGLSRAAVRAFAEERFTATRMARQYDALYQTLLRAGTQ